MRFVLCRQSRSPEITAGSRKVERPNLPERSRYILRVLHDYAPNFQLTKSCARKPDWKASILHVGYIARETNGVLQRRCRSHGIKRSSHRLEKVVIKIKNPKGPKRIIFKLAEHPRRGFRRRLRPNGRSSRRQHSVGIIYCSGT